MERALILLKGTSLSIEEIALMSGYSNSSNFYKAFQESFHMSPREYMVLTISDSPQSLFLPKYKTMQKKTCSPGLFPLQYPYCKCKLFHLSLPDNLNIPLMFKNIILIITGR